MWLAVANTNAYCNGDCDCNGDAYWYSGAKGYAYTAAEADAGSSVVRPAFNGSFLRGLVSDRESPYRVRLLNKLLTRRNLTDIQ